MDKTVPAGAAIAAASPDLFHQAMAATSVHEGGKVDNPKDPGGRTNRGVTQRVYNAWRSKSNLPARDVYLIDDMEVEAIYRFQYWDAIKGDMLPAGVGYVVFDGAVNSGPKQSIKWLQRAMGFVPGSDRNVDGDIGSVTLEAVGEVGDHDLLIATICERRLTFLKALKTWPTFKNGWSRRVAEVEALGQHWASGSIGPQPDVVYHEGGEAKAPVEDAKQAPSTSLGDASIGVGGASVALPQAIDQGIEQLHPFANIGFIKTVIIGLTIAGVVLAVGGAAWRWYTKRQQAKLADALDLQPVAK